jgi:phosphate transport system ATP-binding protein
MSEPGDQMETTDLTHPPGPDEQPAPTDSTDEVAPITVRFDREPRKVEETAEDVVFDVRDLAVSYAGVVAVHKITLPIYRNEITALIGPSGCGKTTFLRCLNRMNDLIETARVEGTLLYHGVNLYDPSVDPVEVRRRIGMVFQKPNPFPKSIYDNIAFGPRIAGFKGNMDQLVEESLRRAALWDEVKDKLKESGRALSGGQQQRLCIARAIATRPDVILMDEPCSALDPIATQRIEDLMQELLTDYTIVIVTHNMQQAARVSDRTAFFTVEVLEETGHRTGTIVEYAETETIFTNPNDPRTEDYVTGRFG